MNQELSHWCGSRICYKPRMLSDFSESTLSTSTGIPQYATIVSNDPAEKLYHDDIVMLKNGTIAAIFDTVFDVRYFCISLPELDGIDCYKKDILYKLLFRYRERVLVVYRSQKIIELGTISSAYVEQGMPRYFVEVRTNSPASSDYIPEKLIIKYPETSGSDFVSILSFMLKNNINILLRLFEIDIPDESSYKEKLLKIYTKTQERTRIEIVNQFFATAANLIKEELKTIQAPSYISYFVD